MKEENSRRDELKDDDETKMSDETVEMIASGYEWVCPICDFLRKEIEINDTVYCENCNTEFEVFEVHHALRG